MWSNFHTHSRYCDGKGELTDHTEVARSKKIFSLGFSSHAPLPFPCKWCMKSEDLQEYLDNLTGLRESSKSIEIYKGLEVDFIPGVISPSTFASQLDYTIGSVHFAEKFENGQYLEIDGPHNLFLEGLEQIFKNNIRELISLYYELTRLMIDTDCPTIVGHLDKIKIQNIDGKFFNESDSWYRSEIEKTLRTIASSGAVVEVNTRGIYQKKTADTYPSPWVLKEILNRNIPVTLNTDAHRPEDLTNEFENAARLLLDIGFKKISTLREGRWQQLQFDQHGFIFS